MVLCLTLFDQSEPPVAHPYGSVDNLAIYPALRRGAKRLLVCQSASSLIKDDATEYAAWSYDASGYFGAIPEGKGPKMGQGNIDAAVVNQHCQVRHGID